MNINKILIWVWILLSSVLIIENAVQPMAYVFIWQSSTMFLSFISICVWIWIWFGLRWFLNWKDTEEESDF